MHMFNGIGKAAKMDNYYMFDVYSNTWVKKDLRAIRLMELLNGKKYLIAKGK